jgi:thiol:disulfide interchange protein
MNRLVIAITALMLLTPFEPSATAQKKGNEVIQKAEARFEPATAKPGDTVIWTLTVTLADHWHTYTTKQADPSSSVVTQIDFRDVPGLKPNGDVIDPSTGGTIDNPDGGPPLRVMEGTFVWERKFEVTPAAPNGPLKLDTSTKFQVCDDKHCLPWDKFDASATLTITGGIDAPLTPKKPSPVAPVPAQAEEVPADSSAYKKTLENILAHLEKQKAPANSGLLSFLLTAVFWGGVSLLTPCVFPMIPITVSFFLKQSERNHANPVLLALVYCGTIVVVLGAASLTLLGFFTALSINPLMNVFLGVLFVVLALSLFGMFDLTLPASLTRFTSSREGQGGLIGTVFMALTFTVVSFTCVAPFLGGFGGMAASGQFQMWELVLGALAFAATFAFPFFLLALFPSLIRKLPKSGGWLHTVKVVMAFIEIAAALKFFRTAELVQFRQPVLFTYDLVLGMWVALCLLCGLYLIKLVHIGVDEPDEGRGVSVPQFLIGFGFISLGLYLLPALFAGGPDGGNQRPRGVVFAWVDSFLLPEPTDTAGPDKMKWSGDLRMALNAARSERQRTGKPAYVFVDFTGETCTNCKLNERSVFSRPDVKDLFAKFQLVQLFTDKVPDKYYPAAVRAGFKGTARQQADANLNRWFEEQAFGSQQLPLYVVLEPQQEDKIHSVGVYDEGKINNVDEFMRFLKKPFESK